MLRDRSGRGIRVPHAGRVPCPAPSPAADGRAGRGGYPLTPGTLHVRRSRAVLPRARRPVGSGGDRGGDQEQSVPGHGLYVPDRLGHHLEVATRGLNGGILVTGVPRLAVVVWIGACA